MMPAWQAWSQIAAGLILSRISQSDKNQPDTMLSTLDTVIAFAVIMTLLSVLITIVVQMVSAALSLRGKNLANALALTFQTIDPKIGKHAHSLAAQILRDPIFSDSIFRPKNRPEVVPNAKTQRIINAEKNLKNAQQELRGDPQNAAKQSAFDTAKSQVESAKADVQSEVTDAEDKLKKAREELAADPQSAANKSAVENAEAKIAQAKADIQIGDVTPNRIKEWRIFSIFKLGDATALGSAIRPGEIYRIINEFAELTPTEAALRDIPPELVEKSVHLLACLQTPDQPAQESKDKLKLIQEVADTFTNEQQQKAVLDSLANFGATVERATTEAYDRFQRWFGSAQDRAEQWFQTHVRVVTIACSICAAFFLQLDTAEIYRQLKANPALVQGLAKAASTVIEEGNKNLDPNNTPAHQAYLQWTEKHPEQSLKVSPTPPTRDEYRRALTAQLTANNVKTEEAEKLLKDYDLLYTTAVKKFEESSREDIERLKKTADEAGFELVPMNFLGRWDQPAERELHGRQRLGRQVSHTFGHLLGILATVGLLALGAPFWFNLLKNLTSLRPALATLIEKRPTSAPALPAAPSTPPSPS